MTEEAIPGFVQVPFSITRFENSIYWYIKGLLWLWQCLIIWLCFRQYCSWMALTLFLLSLLSFSLSIAQRSTCFRYYLTYMRKMLIKMLITMFVFLTMEMSSSDDYNFLKIIFIYQVYLYQWKEFGLSLASQQVGNAISSNFLEMSQIELTWKWQSPHLETRRNLHV